MTDHPRFEPVTQTPAKAHRNYHGGYLVDVVFSAMDQRALSRPTRRTQHSLKLEVGVSIALALLFVGVFAGLGATQWQRTAHSASEVATGHDLWSEVDAGIGRRPPPTFYPAGRYLP